MDKLREVKYSEGNFVRCIEVTPENHEKLTVGEVYLVKGFNVFDGNIVYCLLGADDKLYYSTDRFERAKILNKDVPKLEMPDRLVVLPKEEPKVTLLGKESPGVEQFKKLQADMLDMYVAKNKDYGNSVSKTYDAYGIVSFATRIADKYNRIENLIVNGKAEVKGESLRDTFMDMANYCMLAVMEMDGDKGVESVRPVKYEAPSAPVYPVPNSPTSVCGCRIEVSPRYTTLNAQQKVQIKGLASKLNLDVNKLPAHISPVRDYKDLKPNDADMAIMIMQVMRDNAIRTGGAK